MRPKAFSTAVVLAIFATLPAHAEVLEKTKKVGGGG